jgi:hypothetical protein
LLPTYSSLGATIYQPLAFLAYEFVLPIVPIIFFIAIQRYHLYAIDQLINKALVYGTLSAILAVVFVGGVIGMQALARAVTGLNSPVALVASTLLIASLFAPMRSRIQRVIDRRFYRAKYDAQKTLAAFSATLRQEVSLTALHTQLLAVVEHTMQPTHVSLWLVPPTRLSPCSRRELDESVTEPRRRGPADTCAWPVADRHPYRLAAHDPSRFDWPLCALAAKHLSEVPACVRRMRVQLRRRGGADEPGRLAGGIRLARRRSDGYHAGGLIFAGSDHALAVG